MKKSLQAIEDYYYRKGLRGDALRKATEQDSEYLTILKEKRSRLTKQFKVRPEDKRRYVLSTDTDYEIIGKIYELERRKLSTQDRELVKLIRTQLEHHWRTPILKFLNQLLRRYG